VSQTPKSDKPESLSYRDAGVDIDAGDAFIDVIKPVAKRTQREGCMSGLGGFGALFQVPQNYKEPILVSGTDGVGTKLKLAFDLNKHDTIGIDLVGFCVGAVEKADMIDGTKVKPGDKLIGLASSGAHSNGYSLVRKVIDTYNVPLDTVIGGKPLSEAVLAPTKIYVRPILSLLKEVDVHALAHITGGGITGNLNRVLPEDTHAIVQESAWQWPELFTWMQETANIERNEMYRTFNCGVGMMLVVDEKDVEKTLAHLEAQGETAFLMGDVHAGAADAQVQIV